MRRFICTFCLLAITSLSVKGNPLKVCATTSIIADAIENIGGNKVEVVSLMGPGVDPHLYKVTPKDILSLKKADIVFYNGLHLEGRMGEVLEHLKNGIAVSSQLEKADLLLFGPEKDSADPHIWFDPLLWINCIKNIAKKLSHDDPINEDFYNQRAEDYINKVEIMHDWIAEELKKIPESSRFLITSHDAYNYLGRRYEIKVVGVQGISTATEAGLADIVCTIDLIKKNSVKAVFIESSASPVAIERISNDSNAKIGGELFSDSLGSKGELRPLPDGSKADVGTYLGMFKYNITTIVEALK